MEKSDVANMIGKKALAARMFSIYSRTLDEINNNAKVSEWISKYKKTIPIFDTKFELYQFVNDKICGAQPIDYLEFGVYRGESLRNWISINNLSTSRFIGFDSFEGLPETWNVKNRAGTFDLGGEIPLIDDQRVSLVRGWFQDSLRTWLKDFRPKSQIIIHNDSDLHSSTIFTLTVLDPFIVPGTIVIFDEFSSPLHEFRALHDYLGAYMREAVPIGMTADYASQVAFRFTK